MGLPLFQPDPTCTACPMHEEANHVGMATYLRPESLPPTDATDCLVFIGQNPGATEDQHSIGIPFIGRSGKTLTDTYIPGIDLDSRATIYLTNGLRCGPRSVTTLSYFNACHFHLQDDLKIIAEIHRNAAHRALLFVSAPSVTSFHSNALHLPNVNQRKSFLQNGTTYNSSLWGDPLALDFAVFSTYHPQKVNYEHKFIIGVKDHLELVSRFLSGIRLPSAEPTLIPARPPT